MSARAVALRLARRDARRARGRSLLVLAMVALPVLGVTAADVLVRTYQLDAAQAAQRQVGAADAAVSDSGYARIEQYGGDQGYSTAGDASPSVPGRVPDLAGVLPGGSRTVPDRTAEGSLTSGDRVARAQLRELDYRDPLARGLYAQASGRAPGAPGEVAVTTALAHRLGVHDGDRVGLPAGPATVVGTLDDGARTDAATVLMAAGGLTGGTVQSRLLVDLPAPLTWDLVRAANARGLVVQTRGTPVPGEPPPPYSSGAKRSDVTAVGLVVGMALLEVVLLAGPAFAVGARRQERVLALLGASGATRRDLRRTVLAGGLVVGLAAAAVGAVGGVLTAAAALPLLARRVAELPGPFDVRLPELLAIAGLGAVTALLAALLPAWTASRQDVLAGLTGRRGVRRASLRLPVAGLLATGAGVAVALEAARHRSTTSVLAGAALAELGLVATTPALVGLAGRLGPLLPAAPRLALRDAARHRSRTAPAVAAVLAAVAGSVAVATYVSSLDRDDRQRYTPSAPAGAVTVALDADQAVRAPQVAAALGQALPGSAPVLVRTLGRPEQPGEPDRGLAELEVLPDQQCPPDGRQNDPRCRVQRTPSGELAVGGPAVARAVAGRDVPTDVLDRGGALVPARSLRPDGTAVVLVQDTGVPEEQPRRVSLPAAALPAGAVQQPVLSEAAARATGLPYGVARLAALPGAVPGTAEEGRARAAVLALLPDADVRVERGYVSTHGAGLLALLGTSALLVLGASGIATGLAAADGRADLSTLAAVGASPGLRRRLAAAQSVVIAGLGTLLGAAAGLLPAVGLIRVVNAADSTGYQRPVPFPTVLPWTSIAVTVVVVPLLAGLLAALVTRSRLPLLRRLA